MFLIDDGMLVNYDKVLKPLIEDNSAPAGKRDKGKKNNNDFNLGFLQYEGENSRDANVKPRKSRNSKHAFTITSARKNTSAYQMKNVEVRLQKMTIDEERVLEKIREEKKQDHDFTVFGKIQSSNKYTRKVCNDGESDEKTSSEVDESTASDGDDSIDHNTEDSSVKESDAKDTSVNSIADDVFFDTRKERPWF